MTNVSLKSFLISKLRLRTTVVENYYFCSRKTDITLICSLSIPVKEKQLGPQDLLTQEHNETFFPDAKQMLLNITKKRPYSQNL
jgi:hypothetical protein